MLLGCKTPTTNTNNVQKGDMGEEEEEEEEEEEGAPFRLLSRLYDISHILSMVL